MSTGPGPRGACAPSDRSSAALRPSRYDALVIRLRAHRAPAGRRGRVAVAGALALCWALLVTSAISAEDIVQLEGALTDTTGELADREADIEQTSDRVVDEDGVQVFVV